MSNGCGGPEKNRAHRWSNDDCQWTIVGGWWDLGIQNDKNRHFDYFVHWKGGSKEDGCWEREEALWKWKHKLREFGVKHKGAPTSRLLRTTMNWGRGGCNTFGKTGRCVPKHRVLILNETTERTCNKGTRPNEEMHWTYRGSRGRLGREHRSKGRVLRWLTPDASQVWVWINECEGSVRP